MSLPPELLARLDAYARSEASTRGHVVELAVRAWLDARPGHECAMCALAGQATPAGRRVDTQPGDYQIQARTAWLCEECYEQALPKRRVRRPSPAA